MKIEVVRYRMWLVLGLISLITAAFANVAAAQQPQSPEEVALAFIEARNNGDVAGAMALVVDGGTFQGAGGCVREPCSGDRLREQMQREAALNIQITVLETTVDGNTVVLSVQTTNDRIKQCGVERVLATETYTVSNGKVASVVVAIDRDDEQSAKFLACPPPPAPGAPSTGSGMEPAAQQPTVAPSMIVAVAIAVTSLALLFAGRAVRRRT